MAKLRKSNRIIEVSDGRVDDYLKRGYDQIDDNGKVVKEATGGKKVSVSEFNEMQKRKDEAITKLEERATELYEELQSVKEKAENFADKGKQLQEENKKLKEQLNKGQKQKSN